MMKSKTEDAREPIPGKDKRGGKKKDKKSKEVGHNNARESSPLNIDSTELSENDASRQIVGTPSKKRKREEPEEELEIDLSLPEPLSKKALRKARKSKPSENDAAKIGTQDQESISQPSERSAY